MTAAVLSVLAAPPQGDTSASVGLPIVLIAVVVLVVAAIVFFVRRRR